MNPANPLSRENTISCLNNLSAALEGELRDAERVRATAVRLLKSLPENAELLAAVKHCNYIIAWHVKPLISSRLIGSENGGIRSAVHVGISGVVV